MKAWLVNSLLINKFNYQDRLKLKLGFDKCCPQKCYKLLFYVIVACMYVGVVPGGAGGAMADQLTLSQTGGPIVPAK